MEEKTERSQGLNPELPSLVFMGTPDFAVPSLKALSDAGAVIRLVVTQPDRPKGRGKKRTPSPVKALAQDLGLPVYQPERIRTPEALETLRAVQAECAAVVAYGQILPQTLLDAFPLGALNVHASLLPRYRGAAPIQRSLLAGDARTGVSIMLLDAGMDTGPVLSERALEIGEAEPLGELHDRLARLGAELLLETLALWRAARLVPRPQDDASASLAPPIRKEEQRIAWHLPARRIANTIRAFDPWPGAFALYRGKRLKLFHASLLDWHGEGSPGEIAGRTDSGLVVFAGDGQALLIGELQGEGQRRLPAAAFLRGFPMEPETRME